MATVTPALSTTAPAAAPAAPAPIAASGVATKRKTTAGVPNGNARPVKRRASKACCCCRSRKVRCDVVEHGPPCTNCRLDEVECVVTDSKRKKKPRLEENAGSDAGCNSSHGDAAKSHEQSNRSQSQVPFSAISNLNPVSPSSYSIDLEHSEHVPHLLYQTRERGSTRPPPSNPNGESRRYSNIQQAVPPTLPLDPMRMASQQLMGSVPGVPGLPPQQPRIKGALPPFIRSLPSRYDIVDVNYLEAKGALRIPDVELRTALIKAYIHYVHPFMPLLELEEFLSAITRNHFSAPVSLLLFQAVMFAGTAFVPIEHLEAAGFSSRKAARKTFFLRARLLYDLDYESDRIALVQSLLLMTHWYEMPDDQKDTWHWMGVSLSLAHTIGIHRDPSSSSLDIKRQRLWKRIWWSAYTRDRLIALGMRRPTRIKDEDCDVPLLKVEDFDVKPFSPEALRAAGDCELLLDLDRQRDLAQLFIEKSKLCLCISHVLRTQYSVLSHKNFGGSRETTMMLVPKKAAAEGCEVRNCDQELETWLARLPAVARYYPSGPVSLSRLSVVEEVLHMHRGLLRMIYLTTSSALHRPQVLPSVPMPQVEAELQEISRSKVRKAAVEITEVAQDLHKRDLVKYLSTAGVTVLLPAVIIHLLDIKCQNVSVRAASLNRFYQCMQILERLREIYCSADFASQFLEAAIRKADINLSTTPPGQQGKRQQQQKQQQQGPQQQQQSPPLNPETKINARGGVPSSFSTSAAARNADDRAKFVSTEHQQDSSVYMSTQDATLPSRQLTPPPERLVAEDPLTQPPYKFSLHQNPSFPTPVISGLDNLETSRRDTTYATTPPQSVPSENGSTRNVNVSPIGNGGTGHDGNGVLGKPDGFPSDSSFSMNLQMLNNQGTPNAGGGLNPMNFGIPGLANPSAPLSTTSPQENDRIPGLSASSPGETFDSQDLNAFRSLAHDADITSGDLDALINFDDSTGAEFFAGAEVNFNPDLAFGAPEGMGKVEVDLDPASAFPTGDTDWMAMDATPPTTTSNAPPSNVSSTPCDVGIPMDGPEQI